MKLLKDIGMLFPAATSKKKARYGIYECPVCLTHFRTQTAGVKLGHSTKCKNCRNKTHGLTNHPLYDTWNQEKNRCYNPKNPDYKNYGARGITISKEFLDINIWIDYVESLPDYNKRNTHGYTLDRINNNSNYTRGNLRWESRTTQRINQRIQKTNTSGYKGICWDKQSSKWSSSVSVNKKVIYLGRFLHKEEALDARNNYIIKNDLDYEVRQCPQ